MEKINGNLLQTLREQCPVITDDNTEKIVDILNLTVFSLMDDFQTNTIPVGKYMMMKLRKNLRKYGDITNQNIPKIVQAFVAWSSNQHVDKIPLFASADGIIVLEWGTVLWFVPAALIDEMQNE